MSGDLGNNTNENPYQPLLAGRQEPFGTPDYMVGLLPVSWTPT